MNKGIIRGIAKSRYTEWVIIFVFITLSVLNNVRVKNAKRILPSKKDGVFLPYRTVSAIDGSGVLFPYEFQKLDGAGYYTECVAIIKNIDPAKDDYKTYCRSVISDIVKTAGAENLEVYVYDDNEAYEASEVRLGEEFKGINKSEMDSLEQHLVAVYHGKMNDDDDNFTLYFYQQAHNRYTENEAFEPGE